MNPKERVQLESPQRSVLTPLLGIIATFAQEVVYLVGVSLFCYLVALVIPKAFLMYRTVFGNTTDGKKHPIKLSTFSRSDRRRGCLQRAMDWVSVESRPKDLCKKPPSLHSCGLCKKTFLCKKEVSMNAFLTNPKAFAWSAPKGLQSKIKKKAIHGFVRETVRLGNFPIDIAQPETNSSNASRSSSIDPLCCGVVVAENCYGRFCSFVCYMDAVKTKTIGMTKKEKEKEKPPKDLCASTSMDGTIKKINGGAILVRNRSGVAATEAPSKQSLQPRHYASRLLQRM